jgi:hypothetical protein
MANAVWPATLPNYVLIDGYSEKLPAQKIESPMEAGRPKVRRRFSTNWRQFTVFIKMTADQGIIFESFYQNTLQGGSLPFDWVHPRKRTAATFRFRMPDPEITVDGGTNVIASCAMEQIA